MFFLLSFIWYITKAPVVNSAAMACTAKYMELNGFWLNHLCFTVTSQTSRETDFTRTPLQKAEGNLKKVKRFNPSTGTIYCNNNVEYDKDSIIEARKNIEDRRSRYERNGDAEGLRLCDISSALMELYLNEIDEAQKDK